jgi:hypothetical protein
LINLSSLDDMNIGTRVGGNQTQWKSFSLQRGTPPVGTEVSPPQIPVNPANPAGSNPIYSSANFENADGTLVIRRQMQNR